MKLFKKKFEFGDPVMIEWIDTSGHGGWVSLDNADMNVVNVTQVGLFISQDKEAIRVCQGIPHDDIGNQVVGPSTIPIGCVRSIRRLK